MIEIKHIPQINKDVTVEVLAENHEEALKKSPEEIDGGTFIPEVTAPGKQKGTRTVVGHTLFPTKNN